MKNIIDDIKKYIDAEQVKNKIATDLGLKFKNNKCLCFNHSEKHESMSYYAKGKYYKCFSCGFQYDIFDHYQQYYNSSFLEAVKSIVRDFNLNIDIIINESDRKPKKSPTKHENYNKNILTYCERRNISKNTIDYVGVKENNNCVVFEYRNE